jgi:hypothetical protein
MENRDGIVIENYFDGERHRELVSVSHLQTAISVWNVT